MNDALFRQQPHPDVCGALNPGHQNEGTVTGDNDTMGLRPLTPSPPLWMRRNGLKHPCPSGIGRDVDTRQFSPKYLPLDLTREMPTIELIGTAGICYPTFSDQPRQQLRTFVGHLQQGAIAAGMAANNASRKLAGGNV